jgi:hypothetical protein
VSWLFLPIFGDWDCTFDFLFHIGRKHVLYRFAKGAECSCKILTARRIRN